MAHDVAILVEGPDAFSFLQGQLTCDLTLLKKEYPLRGAHCNIKGRVEALYDIFLKEAGIILVTPEDVIAHALEKLQFYARFSKVKLSIISLDYAIEKKRPRLYPQTLGRFLPQELGLDQTDALSYSKGCYIGQEVVARVHYLGKLKRELVKTPFVEIARPGDCIQHPEWGEVEVVDCIETQALVLKHKH